MGCNHHVHSLQGCEQARQAEGHVGKLPLELHRYRLALAARGIAPDVVLPDLLHLHHTRVCGPDLDAERDCLRTARAAALSQLVRAGCAA